MREFSPSRFIWDKVAHVPLLWIDILERRGEKTDKTWGKRSGEDREKGNCAKPKNTITCDTANLFLQYHICDITNLKFCSLAKTFYLFHLIFCRRSCSKYQKFLRYCKVCVPKKKKKRVFQSLFHCPFCTQVLHKDFFEILDLQSRIQVGYG